MSGLLDNVQPAVKKETGRVVMITGVRTDPDVDPVCEYFIFTMPDKVPFDYTVILGGGIVRRT